MDFTSSRSPSSSASYSTPTRWDVFLSFSGPDTRYKFTSHLLAALDRHGIRTFMDDPELRSGEVISDALLQGIQESNTYIVVLSENYASSPWCLDELVEIYSCYKTMKRSVVAVFYNIDPSVVRHQTESFKKAFEKHEIRFAGELEKMNKWRLTLTEVAGFSGKHIYEKRSEADIINEIVDEILVEINPKTLDVAKYPVGLDSRVKGITTLLGSGAEGVTRIGIYGMGGVGKTTLAKALYNQLLLGSFQDSCFLENVREVSGTAKGLVSLQQQLIDDVLKSKRKVEVHNVDEGTKLIKARICSTKVLVVIDDLDHYKQFESLIGPFASGSVVIITTRDEQILDTIEVEPRYRYMVKELDDAESLALFTRHAFGNALPNSSLMVLSKKIICYAGGLPLALEVFGSYLYKRPEVGWKYFIEKLQRIPNSSIQQRLIISLDALELDDPMLKKMFLDIACFFIGRVKEDVVKIMETYYSYTDHIIDILKKRCLLTINNRDELGMHDLLRNMGREVARNCSPDEPGKYSRLWVSKDICDILKKHKGTKAIEGIIQHYFDYESASKEVSYVAETFKTMSKLRFLHLRGVNLTGSFEHTLEDLRWLRWDRCPLNHLPSEFYPQKLVILELPRSKLGTMWELNMVDTVSQVFEKLKTLNMSSSLHLTTTPDFNKLPCLETLNLHGCTSLEEVHISIGSLVRLTFLNLEFCRNLKRLPDSICNLRALKVLNIGNCSSLESLPIELGKIGSLTELNARGLTVLKLPDSIAHLSKLVQLLLSSNKKLETLPDTICSLRSLEILNISRCVKLGILPSQLWKMTRLKKLDASGATLLKKLPHIKSSKIVLSLKELDLTKTILTALPSGLSYFSNLENLDLTYCCHLLSIAELPPNLKRIKAEGCISLKRLPNLSNLKQLEILELTGCSGLTVIQGLKELTSLRELYLGGCNSSLLTYTLTEHFFQIYSEFGHQINIYIPAEEFPVWISRSINLLRSTVALDLPPNVTDNFLGIILCFKYLWSNKFNKTMYSVKNTTSNFIWSGSFYNLYPEAQMIMIPRSIFSIRDGDHRIELTASRGEILGIHLVYKMEVTSIDEYDSTTVNNTEDESMREITATRGESHGIHLPYQTEITSIEYDSTTFNTEDESIRGITLYNYVVILVFFLFMYLYIICMY